MKILSILVIIQRSNGDVFLSSSLLNQLHQHFNPNSIDLLVNDDTVSIAKTLSNIRQIHTFSYDRKKNQRWRQEINIIKKIYRKYDLSINLTASDRSVLYACIASKYSISAIEKNNKKSWWKKLMLSKSYNFDTNKHIILNNLEPLTHLGVTLNNKQPIPSYSKDSESSINSKLLTLGIKNFIIFHPSAQYQYKIYPADLRSKLLEMLNRLNLPIIVTGGVNIIDSKIKKEIPILSNVFNWIGETSIDEYIALSEKSLCYVGMDTLNMHIAAAQNKPIFALFGPTNLSMWAPWSNEIQSATIENKPIQTYGNITIFQGDMPCVACGNAGCGGNGKSDCLEKIIPMKVFDSVRSWHLNYKINK